MMTTDFGRIGYDNENQMIRVTVTNSWKSEFTYDGRFRRRIRKEFIASFEHAFEPDPPPRRRHVN